MPKTVQNIVFWLEKIYLILVGLLRLEYVFLVGWFEKSRFWTVHFLNTYYSLLGQFRMDLRERSYVPPGSITYTNNNLDTVIFS